MASLSWVRKVAQVVPEFSQIPLFGNAPAFDWHRLSSDLMENLEIGGLSIRGEEQDWKQGDQIRKGLGRNLFSISIAVSPIGSVLWLMSYADVAKIASWMMKPGSTSASLSSEGLQEGFYRYLLLEVLQVVQQMPAFEELTLQCIDEEEPVDIAFCIDVEVKVGAKKSFWGRLVIPQEFQKSWVQHFSHLQTEYVPTELTKSLQLVMGMKIGSVFLTLEQWKKIKLGDFVLLDEASYHPREKKGHAIFTLGSTALFPVRLEDKYAIIVEHVLQSGENMNHSQQEEPKALKEVPLQVNVEIARMKMTLDELVHLSPGNQLELPAGEEGTVSLVVGGEIVGKAELIYLGEKLGLRILEIG
jgi:type III secretion system YscQ/HrcQ family protein